MLNIVLQVRHQEHVPCLVVPTDHGVVVDVAQHGARSQQCRGGSVQVDGQSVNEIVGGLRSSDIGDLGRLTVDRLDGILLQHINNDGRFRVDVFQPPHDGSTGRVLPTLTFKQDLSLDNRLVQGLFLAQSLDVFTAVLIRVLERLGKLAIDALEQVDQASANLDGGVVLFVTLSRGTFDHVVVLASILRNDVCVVGRQEHGDELVEFRQSRAPRVVRHRGQVGRVVETSGDEGEEHSDLLVRRRGNLDQLLQNLDRLRPIRVFPSPTLHDALQRLEHTLARQVERTSASADCHKVFRVGSFTAGGFRCGFTGRSFGCGGVLGRDDSGCVVVCLFECGRVLGGALAARHLGGSIATHSVVRLNSGIEIPQRLLDLLLHPVQPLCIRGIHLLLDLLFPLGSSSDERVQVDEGLDEHRRVLCGGGEGRGEGLMTLDESDELVEVYEQAKRARSATTHACKGLGHTIANGHPIVNLCGILNRLDRRLDLVQPLILCGFDDFTLLVVRV